MKRYVFLAFFLFLLVPSTGGPGSKTIYEVTPHIGNETVSVTQTYYLTEEGLTRFDVLTLSLSYADLRVFDEQGDLDFEVGENIIIGKHLYRTLTVQFRTSLTGPYTFTISYWYPTHATGKPLTGKYVYNIVNLTDSTQFILSVPLTNIRATSRSSPEPSVEYQEDATVFSYQFSEDTRITLAYVPTEEIDYGDVQTDRYPFEDYFFEITYPRKAALFYEDIEFFIEYMFPVYLRETGIPLRYDTIEIVLGKEEDTWAAAEYLGGGKMRVLINNTASYPSTFLAHELTHSHIGDFPRYLEEGMANYFEGRVSRVFAPPLPNSYIPNRESYFQTFERQFNTTVDITEDTYGLGLTDHQEALIYAKYSKGTYCVYEIASVCGYDTVQHMLSILSEQRDCSLNYVIAHLAEGDQAYEILKKYGFHMIPPYMYPTQELLEETQDDSWWGFLLCALARYQSRITEGEPEDIPVLEGEIEDTKLKAAQTLWVMNGLLMVVTAVGVGICSKKIYRAIKKNPQIAYYFYLIPMFIALFIFGYFLYEFLFHGHKARWICENVLLLWGMGILSGSVIALLSAYVLFRRPTLYVPEVIWAVFFFVTVSSTAYFSVMKSILWGVGYGVSAGVLFIIRRNYYRQSAKNIQEKKKKNK